MEIGEYFANLAGFRRPVAPTIQDPVTPDPWNNMRVPAGMDMLHRFAGGQLFSNYSPYQGDMRNYGFGPQHRNYIPDTTGWGTSTSTGTGTGTNTATNSEPIITPGDDQRPPRREGTDQGNGPGGMPGDPNDMGRTAGEVNAGRGLVGSGRGMIGALGGISGVLGGYATRNSFLEGLNKQTPNLFEQSFNPFGQGSFMGKNALDIAVSMLSDPHVPGHVQDSIAQALQGAYPGREAGIAQGWSGAQGGGAQGPSQADIEAGRGREW